MVTIRALCLGLGAFTCVLSTACERNAAQERFGPENAPPVPPPPKVAANAPGEAAERADSADASARQWPYGAIVGAIAKARCDREARCNNVGNGKEFASESACVETVRTQWHEELNAFACKGGIVEDELTECLEAIRNEHCGSRLDSLRRLVACRSGDICNAQGAL